MGDVESGKVGKEAVDAMVACLKDHELPVVGVPEGLVKPLKQYSEFIWGTQEDLDVYLYEGIINRIEEVSRKDFFVLGMGGHGFNSTVFSWYVNYGGVMYLLQIPFGGMKHDQEASVKAIEEGINLVGDAQAFVKKGLGIVGKTLVLLDRKFLGMPEYCWIERGQIVGEWQRCESLREALK